MGTITLSVPDELKHEMDETDFINWSSVARRAFAQTLDDVKRLELFKKTREISEISDDDKREVKDSIVKDIVRDIEHRISSGEIKPKDIKKFLKDHKS